MDFKATYQTKNLTKGVNTMKFLIVHNTGTRPGTLMGNIRYGTGAVGRVSFHYLVDFNGDVYKLAKDTDICRHCEPGVWGMLKNMNCHSIGIEVIGMKGTFTMEQKIAVKELLRMKMKEHNISKENVLRHCDVTSITAPKMILRDGKSSNRKVDIDTTFFQPKYPTRKDYQNSLPVENK